MTHDQLEAAVPLYAAGALERVERQALEAHLLTGCIPCRTTLKEYQLVAVTLPFGLTITPPPRSLKSKILSARESPPASESETQSPTQPSLQPGEWMNHLFPPSSPPATSFGWALGTVIFVVLIILVLFGWNSSTHMTQDMEKLAQLQWQAEETGSQLAALQQQLSERDNTLAQTREELQRRTAELAEVRDQLFQREVELEEIKSQLPQQRIRATPLP
jgi:DNA repair exonuclease SbcCD ATPase subunit